MKIFFRNHIFFTQTITIILSVAIFNNVYSAALPKEEMKKEISDLFNAVKENDIKQVEQLIAKKIDLNVTDEKDFTPLFYATENENVQLVRLLLNSGADPEKRFASVLTAEFIAQIMRNEKLIEIFKNERLYRKLAADRAQKIQNLKKIKSPLIPNLLDLVIDYLPDDLNEYGEYVELSNKNINEEVLKVLPNQKLVDMIIDYLNPIE